MGRGAEGLRGEGRERAVEEGVGIEAPQGAKSLVYFLDTTGFDECESVEGGFEEILLPGLTRSEVGRAVLP